MNPPRPLTCPICERVTTTPGLCADCASFESLRRAFDDGQQRLQEREATRGVD